MCSFIGNLWCRYIVAGEKTFHSAWDKNSSSSHPWNLIDKVIHVSLRATIAMWNSTPNQISHRENGIWPAQILPETDRLRLAAPWNTLDKRRPLRSWASICWMWVHLNTRRPSGFQNTQIFKFTHTACIPTTNFSRNYLLLEFAKPLSEKFRFLKFQSALSYWSAPDLK